MNPNSLSNNTNTVGAVRLTNAAGGFTGGIKPIDKKITPSNPFVKVGYMLLTFSFILSIGIYFYDQYLQKLSAQTLSESLQYRDEVKNIPLIEMHDLLNKLTSFNDVASKHTKVTTVFKFMETMTNKNVYWKGMSLRFNEKGIMEVNLSGAASNYAALIQQLDELKDSKYREFISVPVISGTVNKVDDKINNKSEVLFAIKFNFLIPYEESKDGAIFAKLFYDYKNNNVNSKLNGTSSLPLIIATGTQASSSLIKFAPSSSTATTTIIKNTQKNINNLIKNVP